MIRPRSAVTRLILKCPLSPGDIVMLTAAVRDLHLHYPGRFQTDVRTLCPELWENNPHLTPLGEEDKGVKVLECSYPLINQCNQVPYHAIHGFIEFLNEKLGLSIRPTSFKGDIHLSRREKAWLSQVREVTGHECSFWIIAAGGKHDVTIKWWETKRYQEVVDRLRDQVLFVQVGKKGNHHPKLEGTVDLRGHTTLRELIRLVYHSEGIVCPVTALMHLAAAVERKSGSSGLRPCVVIAGGREPIHWEAYPGHQFIHTIGALSCCAKGGCWKDRTKKLRDGDKRDRRGNRCHNLANDLPRCMDLITSDEVVGRIKTYFAGGHRQFLRAPEQKAARRGIEATAQNPYDFQSLTLHSAGTACDEAAKKLGDYPRGFSGSGIVICAGGLKYLTNAWVCIQMLRKARCELPIEIWHLGKAEMPEAMKALFEGLGVQCVNAHQIRNKAPARILKGWQLKPYAMLHSRFKDIMLLDADNVPVRDPAFLFNTPQYADTGAIFWPDYFHPSSRKANPIWRSCGLKRPKEPEFESGQMALDKERCWKALNLSMWFNENSDFYYNYLYGDKETFHLAFRKVRKPYSLVPHPIQRLEGAMCQHDFEGRRLFQHRNTDKWDLSGRNKTIGGFWMEEDCLQHIARLRALLEKAGDAPFKHRNRLIPRLPFQNRWLAQNEAAGGPVP